MRAGHAEDACALGLPPPSGPPDPTSKLYENAKKIYLARKGDDGVKRVMGFGSALLLFRGQTTPRAFTIITTVTNLHGAGRKRV